MFKQDLLVRKLGLGILQGRLRHVHLAQRYRQLGIGYVLFHLGFLGHGRPRRCP